MGALGFVFISLPVLAIVSFTCFAAYRAQQARALKILSIVFPATGLLCLLTPVGLVGFFWLTL